MRTPAFARSSAITFAGGSNLTINHQFLNQSPIPMTAPMIRQMWLRITGLITFGGAATVPGENLILELVNRVLMTDQTGDVISASGASLRQWAQRCLGAAYVDPADVVAGGAGDQPFEMLLPIPFESRRHIVASDFHKPVSDLGGPGSQIVVTLGSGTLTPSASTAVVKAGANVEMWAELTDAGTRAAQSRLRIRDTAVPSTDFRYEVRGSLVDAWYSVSAANIVAGTTAAARNFISDGLAYLNYASSVLNQRYKSQLYAQAASDDVSAGFALDVYSSNNDQSQLESPDLDELQIKYDVSTESGAQVVICAVTPRNQNQVAAAVGTSPAAVAAVAGPTGNVIGAGGFHTRATLPAKASAFLPVAGKVSK
jgi:hypothetical protein